MGTPEAGKYFLEALVSTDGCFDHTALSGLRDIRATPGRVQCTMRVDDSVQNRYQTLHGGCTATLVDTVGSAALITVSTRSGVSLNISTTYLSAMPAGEDVEVDARVVRVGKTVATINVDLRRKKTGELTAQGVHTKFISASEQEMKGIPSPKAKL